MNFPQGNANSLSISYPQLPDYYNQQIDILPAYLLTNNSRTQAHLTSFGSGPHKVPAIFKNGSINTLVELVQLLFRQVAGIETEEDGIEWDIRQ